MIEIKNLTVNYHKKIVLDRLNLTLKPHCIHGLIGLNGSGKTTLLNTLYQYIKPKAGQILYHEKTLNRHHVAYLPTQNFFYNRITGKEYLQLFQANNKKFDISEWNEIFNLPLNELVSNYSTGMKKKLALIAILSLDRPIIILDEPSNGLDLESNQILKKIILRLKAKEKTVIITSHILEMLWTICDEIHHLQNKSIQKSYLPAEFKVLEENISNQQQDKKLDQLI